MFDVLSWLVYAALALVALWGAFSVVMVISRINEKRFKSEEEQNGFLDAIESDLLSGNLDGVQEMCQGDRRALPMMVHLACVNRELGLAKIRQLLVDRFQRDVIADLEVRMTWVSTVIKTAPMLGLFGTVLGMMGAFGTLATQTTSEAEKLADDINVALRTTAIGLAIAIPLVMAMASVSNRIRQLEDLVSSGLTRVMEQLRAGWFSDS
jgi:biopolymer transport protein ExbB/TolQ